MAASAGGPEPSIFRLEHGPVPLYHQVYLRLRDALNAGEWQPGDRMPGERELAQRFDCSVITVRQALGALGRERRLRRMRGRGTFVTDPPVERDLTRPTSFTAGLNPPRPGPHTKPT